MNKFGFILGRETELSKAEIFAYLKKNSASSQIILNKNNTLILATEKKNINLDHLGGSIKLFRLLGEEIEREDLKKFIQTNLEIQQTEQRVNFGLSGYGNIQSNYLYALGKNIKDKIIESGLKARLVTSKFKDLSSVIVHENKLIERGFELIIIEAYGKFYVGQTIAVQDYKAYSKRDFGRTARDDKSGMLPPKLAQILINLGAKDTKAVIYDPFCGSGTVLQEALLMGHQHIYGSDISPKAVTDTQENLLWLLSRHSELDSESKGEVTKKIKNDIFQSDILSPTRQLTADLIVGEGYLGEPTRRNVKQAKDDAKKLTDFYLRALSNIAKITNENGRVVLALPYFIIGKEKVYLDLVSRLHLTGLKQIDLGQNIKTTERNTLLYSRPDAFVGREIFVLEKN